MRVSSISFQFLLLQKSFFLSSAFLSCSSNRHHEIISSKNTFTSLTANNNLNKASPRTSLNQSSSSEESFAKAPSFNGQLTLPLKVISSGLSNTTPVAAVYAIQSDKPSRPNDASYTNIKHIGFTKDLAKDLTALKEKYGGQIAYVRALSFAYPQKAAMMEVANRWASMVHEQGGSLGLVEKEEKEERSKEEKEELVRLMMETADYDDDDDDDDDDDEFEFDEEDTPAALFVDKTSEAKEVKEEESSEEEEEKTSPFEMPTYASTSDSTLEFNLETVDKVLDEIRPYLISDGGNVSIHSVNEETRSVYLVLEGACGSCASSTVTMQMGIERVLKENFDNLGEVAQVTPEEDGVNGSENANELTMDAVMKEVNRIKPAITAMGGQVDIVSVDPLGVVEVRFRGANKVQQGLELALRDVKFVKHVKFVQ
ncbi:hypothetical protein CTEN210_11978 [Chaetoceros tenuissimus]|uniref:NIF system FeS cluster assembly NifU C-terminal domain-containing protein n=1 Tax=Chaetoceros tenuissimus TaxID=426638 RepID=A0AAD3H9E6_9STRA|nr:hypothetical protein CTEN210_11978 [Chaetoceros tenuissimus]